MYQWYVAKFLYRVGDKSVNCQFHISVMMSSFWRTICNFDFFSGL